MKPVKVISVTGGKGGVGKTTLTVNLALALQKMGKKVLLMDADLGLANIDIMLGLRVTKNISHVLEGECSLADVIVRGPDGLQIIPASSGTQKMAGLSPQENAGLIHAFSELGEDIDYLIIDTAAGISSSVVSFAQASQDVIMVVCDEPTSITDAYALMKILSKEHKMHRFRIVANMAHSPRDGKAIMSKLTRVCDQFLDVSLDYCGVIPYDENVRKAVKKQTALLDIAPRSPASLAIKSLAGKVTEWRIPDAARGYVEFFMERLLSRAG